MIDRKKYLEMCQINSAYPNSIYVEYLDMILQPKALKVWFNGMGEPQNSAILLDKKTGTEITCKLQDVFEIKKGE